MTTDEAKRRLTASFPQLIIHSIDPAGDGLGNFAFFVNHEWIFRFSRNGADQSFKQEIELLKLLQGKLSFSIPQPEYIDHAAGVTGYRALSGTKLLDLLPLSADQNGQLALRLAQILNELHGLNENDLQFFRSEDNDLSEWWRSAKEAYGKVCGEIPLNQRQSIEKFFSNCLIRNSGERVFCHNDLGVENIFVDHHERAIGLIDWGEASWTDPAHDLGRIVRDLGIGFLDILLENYTRETEKESLRARTIFVARCSLIEDLYYGLCEGKPAYSEKSFAKLYEIFTEQ